MAFLCEVDLSVSERRVKTTVAFVLLSTVGVLCYAMGVWIVPFVSAFGLAYAFHVPFKKLSVIFRISEFWSAAIMVLSVVSVVALLAVFLLPLLKDAVLVLAQRLPALLQTFPSYLNDALHGIAMTFGIDRTFDIGATFQSCLEELTSHWVDHISSFIGTGITLIYAVAFIFMIPIIMFYILKDWRKIETSFTAALQKIVPPFVVELLGKINSRLGSYVRGQMLVCVVLSILYSVGLFFVGVEKYVVCGIFSGILSIAPFLGPLIGLLTTVAMSLDAFTSTQQYIVATSLYLLIPFLDANFITPKLIGRNTGIQPVWLLFSICATAAILGSAGVFISVPLAVILSTICKELMKQAKLGG